MKETGNAIINKGMDTSFFLMAAFIQESTSMGNLKESANTLGQMASPTKESGLMDSNMALACGKE
jgi:hypothetical protein